MNDLIMNCNCHQSAQPGNEIQADITQQVIMPCDPETIARMFAEYYPQKPVPELPKLSDITSAIELCRKGRIKLEPGAESLLEEGLTPQAYFERLLSKNYQAEARRILAYAMPKRRALWWACLCVQDAYQDELPEPVARSVGAVTKFVEDPSEANRREAERVGKQLPFSRLEGCLAMAAFLSDGNISLPHLPIVQPKPHVTGRLISVCVYLASVTRSALHYKQHLRQYLAMGVEIARGRNLWDEGCAQRVRIDQPATAGTAEPSQRVAGGSDSRFRSSTSCQEQD